MKLTYRATTKDGTLQTGSIEAKDIQEAVYFLRAKEMLPISIKKQQEDSLFSLDSLFKKKASGSDLVLFTRQLSSILASGLTLMQALSILREQVQSEAMREIVATTIADVQEGKPLSAALTKFPKVFTPVYVSLIKAGESSGFLDKILERLADTLEKNQKLKGTIKSALLYPVIIVALMGVVMVIMMLFVVPQLTVLYANLGISLPFATQVVVGISNIVVDFWPLVIGFIALIIFLYRRWVSTDSGALIRDEILLRVPVFGRLISLSLLTEFSRTLGLLISAGTLVVQSLIETSDAAGNLVYKNAIIDISKRVEKGIGMGDAMSTYNIFPPILIQMTKIGEQTGKLDESLLKVSEYFEREVEGGTKGLTTALEPFIMIVLGIGVAFLIISIITPIYSLTSSLQ